MFRTLYARLALVLFLLFCLVGGVFLISALYSAHMYQQEVAQRLNRDLAGYIVKEHVLMRDGQANEAELEHLFHTLMIINPSLELYLLGPQGQVLSYSAAPGKVQRQQVSLEPVEQLLGGEHQLPVLGDDPRSSDRNKAFSAAPIVVDGQRQGYIYAILGGEQVDHVTDLLGSSYILRWSAVGLAAALLFALLAGLAVFALLTRRLRRLSQAMETFKQNDFTRPVSYRPESQHAADDIDRIGLTFASMAERIQEQMTQLRETDSLRRELVANVSHDLRTPLASLEGYLETLLLKEDTLTAEERKRYLAIAGRHAKRLSKLVLELFELAKLDARELKPHTEPFSPAELLHDVMQKYQLRAREQGVDIVVDRVPDAAFAEADIGMIERVLDNLIENALRHTPAGGTIRLSVSVAGDHVTVKVADTGCGIPAEALPHVFKRFYRTTSESDGTARGAGLGLAIAQRIVELHGGRISVESVIDSGSVFGIDLPVHDFTRS